MPVNFDQKSIRLRKIDPTYRFPLGTLYTDDWGSKDRMCQPHVHMLTSSRNIDCLPIVSFINKLANWETNSYR